MFRNSQNNLNEPEARNSSHPEALVTLDLGPLVKEWQTLNSTFRQSHEQNQQAITECNAKNATVDQKIERINKNILALFNCQQAFEKRQDELTAQHLLQWFLKPLAKKLIEIRNLIFQMLKEPDEAVLLSGQIDEVLADFGIDIIIPEPGDLFDPQIMKPRTGKSTNNQTSVWVIESLCLPGACFQDTILVYAQVRIAECTERSVKDADQCMQDTEKLQQEQATQEHCRIQGASLRG